MSTRGVFVALATTVVALGAGIALTSAARRQDAGVKIPAPMVDPAPAAAGVQKVGLAGGCFWGIQAVFQHVNGVTSAVSGYAGGHLENPTYEDVTTETTGHAETVLVSYDPSKVSFGTLLQVFFSVGHDPTELDRQGPDVGPSYRSNIFYTNDAQRTVAEAYIAQLDKARTFPHRIVTRVDRLTKFYEAEDYHQDFLLNHPTYPYIVINDLPKLENLKRLLPALYRGTPVRVSGR
jgi:peptide-methionine (S)-S-oxide reductase